MNCFSLIRLIPVFWSISNIDTTFPHTYDFPASLTISVKFDPGQMKPSLTQSSSCSSSVSIFCPRQSEANQVYYKLYTDHDTLWVKHATLQKSESLRAVYLSKLDNMVNNSIFNTKYAEFSTKC